MTTHAEKLAAAQAANPNFASLTAEQRIAAVPTNLHSRECFDHAWKCATENLWTALGDDEATVADVQRQLAEVTSAAALLREVGLQLPRRRHCDLPVP